MVDISCDNFTLIYKNHLFSKFAKWAEHILYDHTNYQFNPQTTGIAISKRRVCSALIFIYRQRYLSLVSASLI